MNIDLSKLLSSDNASAQYSLDDVLTQITVSGETYPVIQTKPLLIDVKSKGNRKLHLEYAGAANVVIPCARCLEPVEYPVQFEGEYDVDQTDPEDESDFFIYDKELHPEFLFMDEILVHWPIRVLCKEDCKGICSQCGANLNNTVCECDRRVPDPRMAAIKDIFKI